MKPIKIDLSMDRFKKKPVSKHKYLWQAQAEEVGQWFGASLYWLFHRFHPDEIMAEYKWFKEKGDKDKGHFIAMLGWKKKKQG